MMKRKIYENYKHGLCYVKCSREFENIFYRSLDIKNINILINKT